MARKSKLTQAEWVEIGRKVKRSSELLFEVARLSGRAVDAPTVDLLLRVARKIDAKIKNRLDEIACSQYPDWRDATKVFYGPTEPKIDSE